mmetsp:Transcript_4123/g.9979  ORF Transcript_4123/g.9979 Transcript_4123/m.9979 type:complete len:85 (+) Transcript_4123:512-766(+)
MEQMRQVALLQGQLAAQQKQARVVRHQEPGREPAASELEMGQETRECLKERKCGEKTQKYGREMREEIPEVEDFSRLSRTFSAI